MSTVKRILLIFMIFVITNISLPVNAHSVDIDFYHIFEEHGTVMLLIDLETGAIEHANKAASKFYGYSIEELESKNISEINNLTPEEIKTRMESTVKNRGNYVVEQRLASGEMRTVEVYSCPHRHEDKTLIFATLYDVTDKIVLEKKNAFMINLVFFILTMSIIIIGIFSLILYKNLKIVKKQNIEISNFNELKRTYIDANESLIYLKDENFKYVFINEAVKNFFNLNIEEIEGHEVFEFADEDYALWSSKTDKQVLEKNITVVDELVIKNKVYQATKFPVKLNNKHYGVGAYIKDITREYNNIKKIEERNTAFNKSNALLSAILESSPEIIVFALDTNYCYLSYNKKHKDTIKNIWGKEIELNISMLDVIRNSADKIKAKENFDKALAGNSFTIVEEYGDESLTRLVWRNFYSPIYSNEGKIIGLTCFVINITDRIKAERKLKKSELLLRESQKAAHIGSYLLNFETKTWIVSTELNEIMGINNTYTHNIERLYSLIHPDWYKKFFDYFAKTKTEKQRFDYVLKAIRYNNGKEIWVHVLGEYEFNNYGEVIRLIGTIQDITQQREAEEKVIYLSYHDELTGLYNKRFFEEELNRLDVERNMPISIIVGDMNGLKLANDIFGHAAGDLLLQKVAEVFKKVCRADDIIARVGGDEFTILLPQTNTEETKEIILRIKNQFSKEYVKAIKGNISMGCATKNNTNDDILQVLKIAEDNMYYAKVLDRNEVKSTTIKTIIEILHQNSPREKEHSKNVSRICVNIGKTMNLSEEDIRKLREAGFLHNIGKIVLNKGLLNKSGILTDQELNEMKQHPVVGYRILHSFNDTLELAESILTHHERWDGTGLPKGLKGEEIPKLARIIAVADCYDQLTSRLYEDAISSEKAVNLIKKQTGSRFDPEVVNVLENILLFDKTDNL